MTAPTRLPLSTESPEALAAWHERAQTLDLPSLPSSMNAVDSHTTDREVPALLRAAVAWDVRTLSSLLRADPQPEQALLTQALDWAMHASPTVLRANASGIRTPALGVWADGMTTAREVMIELLVGQGAQVQGSTLVSALYAYHGPEVMARLLAAPEVSQRIPRVLGRHETVLHVAARFPYEWAPPMLVAAGADPNDLARFRVRNGEETQSPLGVAASHGLVAVCEQLVGLGADPRRASTKPGDLGDIAQRNGHPGAVGPLQRLEERLALSTVFDEHAPAQLAMVVRERTRL